MIRHEIDIKDEVLDTPGVLRDRFPITEEAEVTIKRSRAELVDILNGVDDRLIVIVGPCSMDASLQPDGTSSVVAYARQLREFSRLPDIAEHLKIVMRCPVSKPRTQLGWAGLSQTDPVAAFRLLTEVVNSEMPIAIELLSRDDADFYEAMLSIAWVGARNVEDTTLRHVVSDLQVPAFFKNSTNGSVVAATNAIITASEPNILRRIRPDGKMVRRTSLGNNDTGMIFRGGNISSPEEFAQQFIRLEEFEYPTIIDCSHGNSMAFGEGKKTVEAQIACVKALITLMRSGHVLPTGIMMESYLVAGSDPEGATSGMSLTDPCINLDQTFEMLRELVVARGERKELVTRAKGRVALM